MAGRFPNRPYGQSGLGVDDGEGDGSPPPRLHGGRLFERATEEGMGPRIREDNGRGMSPRPPRLHGGGISTRGQR